MRLLNRVPDRLRPGRDAGNGGALVVGRRASGTNTAGRAGSPASWPAVFGLRGAA